MKKKKDSLISSQLQPFGGKIINGLQLKNRDPTPLPPQFSRDNKKILEILHPFRHSKPTSTKETPSKADNPKFPAPSKKITIIWPTPPDVARFSKNYDPFRLEIALSPRFKAYLEKYFLIF